MTHCVASMTRAFLQDYGRLPESIRKKTDRVVETMLSNPWTPTLSPEQVNGAEPGVYSCRIDDKYRVIWKHSNNAHVLFCLVDTHDAAYLRAARKVFMLTNGIPLVADLQNVADLKRTLPPKDYELLLRIGSGNERHAAVPDEEFAASLEKQEGGYDIHTFTSSEEFRLALQGDLEEWMLFMPQQQWEILRGDYPGPMLVKGVSGSGKTVMAIRRAQYLAKKLGGTKTILFATFGTRLPQINKRLLERLAGPNARELETVECTTIQQWCERLVGASGLHPEDGQVQAALAYAVQACRKRLPKSEFFWNRPQRFFADEMLYAIKHRAISKLDQYLALDRGPLGSPLCESERLTMWDLYQEYQLRLEEQRICEHDDIVARALQRVQEGGLERLYRAAVVDEVQDLTEAQLRLIRAIVSPGPNDLFLVGDGLQRLYPGVYALDRAGISISGRSFSLRRNYRNTHEILRAAFAMMGGIKYTDVDGRAIVVEEPLYSPRRGPVPELRSFSTAQAEVDWVVDKVDAMIRRKKNSLGDFAVLFRQVDPYRDLLQQRMRGRYGLAELTEDADTYFCADLKHTTFFSSKSLEFKVVFVIGLTDGLAVPRADKIQEGPRRDEYMILERCRLFVAMTRARDQLYLSYSGGQLSRFLSDVPDEYLSRK